MCELNFTKCKKLSLSYTFTEEESSNDWTIVTLLSEKKITGVYKAELPPEIGENHLVQHYWFVLATWFWLMLLIFLTAKWSCYWPSRFNWKNNPLPKSHQSRKYQNLSLKYHSSTWDMQEISTADERSTRWIRKNFAFGLMFKLDY